MGSEFSDIRDVIQVRLHRGEVVEILDSKEFRSGPEAGTWYKVAPPSGEFRWIAGKFVDAEFPHDGVRQSTAENNPLIHPTVTVRPEAAGPSAGPAWPPGLTARRSAAALAEETADPPLAASTDPRLAGGGQEPSAQDVAAGPATGPGYASRQFSPSQPTREISPEEFQAQLDQLNSELAVMLVEEPSVWKFDELGLRARDLVNQAETAIERGRRGQLVARIEQSEDVKLRYDTIHNLKTQTERENRQLAQTVSARAAGRLAISPEPRIRRHGPAGAGRLREVRHAAVRPGGRPEQRDLLRDAGPGREHAVLHRPSRGHYSARGYDTNARTQHLMAQHVTPLENGGTTVR